MNFRSLPRDQWTEILTIKTMEVICPMTCATDAKVGFCPACPQTLCFAVHQARHGWGLLTPKTSWVESPGSQASERGRQRWWGGRSTQRSLVKTIKEWHKGYLSSWHSIAKRVQGKGFECTLNWTTGVGCGGSMSWTSCHLANFLSSILCLCDDPNMLSGRGPSL